MAKDNNNSIAHIHCIYDNLGDIAVAEAAINIFNQFNLITYSSNSRLRGLEEITKKQLFANACLGGGTLIFSPLDTDWFLTLKHFMSNKIGVLFTYGTGVRDPGFFKDITSDTVSKWIEYLQKFSLVSVRGLLSRDILNSYGLKNVQIIGDPALLYCRDKIKSKNHNKKIGINISQNHQFYGAAKDRVLDTISGLIGYLLNDNWEITLFPSCKEDVALSNSLLKIFSNKIKIHKNYNDIESFLSLQEEQDIFIGVKLHTVILAFCAYTPSLMIAYQPKCYDFMQTMEMNDFILRCDVINPEDILQKINFLYEHTEEIQKLQFIKCREFKQKQLDFRDQVYRVVHN